MPIEGQLKDLVESWKQIRLHYPGWVIAPSKSREELWEYTSHWMAMIFAEVVKYKANEALPLLYELNWRLETCLCPLLISQAELMAKAIEAVTGRARSKGSEAEVDRDQLLSLHFAVLREAREDLDHDRWTKWSQKTFMQLNGEPSYVARWNHEQCLFWLNSLRHRKVDEALAKWVPTPELPFWEAKRASIFAELGQVEEAEQIAEKALSVIRSRLKPFVTDYGLLSQEGLVMGLLRAVRWMSRIARGSGPLPDNKGYGLRWTQLEAYGCNPWTERRVLELAVSASPPEWPVRRLESIEFDPGRGSVTRRFVSNSFFYEYLPGFAYLRHLEEGGLPFRCGQVTTAGDKLPNATDWVEPFAPLWALTALFRAGSWDKLKESFTRVRVATLSDKEVDTVYNLLTAGLEDSFAIFEGGRTGDASFGGRLLPAEIELLSRLAFRFDSDRLDSLIQIALRIYSMRNRAFDTHECLTVLFSRVLDAASAHKRLEWMPALLRLSIPENEEFAMDHLARRFPEPMNRSDWSDLAKLKQKLDIPHELKKNLFDIVANGTHEARQRAICRINALYEADLLNASDRKAYGRALWSRLNSKNKLPTDSPFYEFALLNLPNPRGTNPEQALHDWILEEQMPALIQVTEVAGKERVSWDGGYGSQHFFTNLSGSTKKIWDRNGNRRFIRWTSEDSGRLLRKLLGWWDDSRRYIERIPDAKQRVQTMSEVVAEVVVPSLSKNDLSSIVAIQAFYQQLVDLRIPSLELAVGLEKLGSREPGLDSKIILALRDSDGQVVRDAVDAAVHWCVWFATEKYRRSASYKILRALVSKVIVLKEPGLREAIWGLRLVVEAAPRLITAEFDDLLGLAISHLDAETRLEKRGEVTTRQKPGVLAVEKTAIPEIRTAAAGLAHQILEFCAKRKRPMPESVVEWRAQAGSEVLPEVRKAWRVDSSTTSVTNSSIGA